MLVFALALLAAAQSRPPGPCDIYGAAGTPCVAAHSTTRALFTAYSGPLYQVKRQSDGKSADIGLLADGYANAAAQDTFCANTICVINVIYDQSGRRNHLLQAPPGPLFPGPAKGAFDTQPIADMAPITISGHKAYGVYIMPGMGLRNNDARDLAIDDEPEGIYYVIDGKHYDSGCCFDYGNCSTNGRAVGTGTMETTYFGTSTTWGSGSGPGPWIMADMEAGLFSGYNARQNPGSPTIDSWRFVTAMVNGGGGNRWELRGGNAQAGPLTTFYRGIRPGSQANNAYYPMHKQGAILLGNGGDNGNGSAGTFYEGVMTSGYPSEAATDAVHASIVAARYDGPPVALSRLTTFTPGSTQQLSVAGAAVTVTAPKGWIVKPVAGRPNTFLVTSPAATGMGFLIAKAEWKEPATGRTRFETATQRIRNVLPVKINEVGFGTGQFIELFNPSSDAIDIAGWTLVHTASQWASVPLARIPAATKLAAGGFYLLSLAGSGLAGPASAGATTIHVRSTEGMAAGQVVDIEGERRSIVSVGTAAAPITTVFIPVSTGPWLSFPAGATNLPVTSAAGFEVGRKMAIDLGGDYELVTVTKVGKAATQTTLASPASAGDSRIKVAASANMAPGDTLTIGTGGRKEQVKIVNVSVAGVDLTAPLQRAHASGVDVSDIGTGISFSPATRFPHRSGDAVQALGSGLTLDHALARAHAYGAPVLNPAAAAGGYQGPPAPDQWLGSVLSSRAGSIALLDAGGAIVDAVVYGSQQSNSSANGTITSPELATLEGDQGQGGCIAVLPGPTRGFGLAASADAAINRSLGRFPDGADVDSLCTDFLTQPFTVLSIGSAAAANNIKVASVDDLIAGQTITIDTGTSRETAVIAEVGTPGGTTLGGATSPGATVIPVASTIGFVAGQAITIDSGANRETAIVVSTLRRRDGATINLAAPLAAAHAVGAQISGSGITLTTALAREHAVGAQVAGGAPTPAAPNQYRKRRD